MMTKNIPFIPVIPPYKHQSDDLAICRDMSHYAWFWEMGCGKSKQGLDNACHLFVSGKIDGVLLISDKGCYLSWPNDHIPKHVPESVPHRVAAWSSRMTSSEERQSNEILEVIDDCLDFACINVEALSSPRGVEYCRQFLKKHAAMMIVDESTSIKNPTANRTKAVIELGRMCKYRRIMSGTPITQSPLDLWSQCEFLKPGLLGYHSFVAFRNRYATMHEIVQGTRRFKIIIGYRGLDELTISIRPFSSRFLKDQCLDLPEKIYETLYVEHTQEQAQLYRQLREEAVLQLDQGLLTANSALSIVGKLQQINCGHVKIDDDTTVDIPSNRIKILLDLVSEIEGKVVIWARYQRDIHLIYVALNTVYPGKVVKYYGETDAKERAEALARFSRDKSCKFYVATAASCGKGINELVVASTVIYYSNSYNLEHRLQSEDRNHRPGQNKNVLYFDLVCPGTVDVAVLKRLRDKKDIASEVLDLIREL